MANKITYRSAQDMALKHISAYAKQLAKGIDTDYNYYIGQNIVSSSYLNTKETRRLNKLVLRQGKLFYLPLTSLIPHTFLFICVCFS